MPERLPAVIALVLILLGVLWGRFFHLQVVEGARYALLVEQSTLVRQLLPPRRGRILDRNGQPLADTRPLYHLGVTLADLELAGKERRDLPLWRLDERAFDALCADLTTRLRWIGRERPLAAVVIEELLASPGVAVRTGRQAAAGEVALVWLPRRSLEPTGDEESTLAQGLLVESDLLCEDPRDALARELAARRGQPVQVVGEEDFAAACAALDANLAREGESPEPSASVLAPFAEPCVLRVPVAPPPDSETAPPMADLPVRVLLGSRRAQAELALARVVGEEPATVHELLTRALVSRRRPLPPSQLYYAAAAEGEQIAPLLPVGTGLGQVAVPDAPGARERIWILQGDPADGEGLYAELSRRLAASLGGLSPLLVQAVIESHAERIRVAGSERSYRIRHQVLDPVRTDRLITGLARALTALGRPTTATALQARLAEVRRLAERELTGQTRHDAIPLVKEVPQRVAVRLAGAAAAPPTALRRDYEESDPWLPGLSVVTAVGRSYPAPGAAPHIIGMLGRDDDPERPGGLKGRSGLEATYDDALRGVVGSRIYVRSPDGNRTIRMVPSLPGQDLRAEVDLELQMLAEDSLGRYVELAGEQGLRTEAMAAAQAVGRGRAGFALIDCHTGGIIALASTPVFDLERASENWDQLLKEPGQPLIDHAAAGADPPGSSFKILTALCGLEHAVMSPGEQIFCKGYMAMHQGRPVLKDHAPAGIYDLQEAIQMSSNVYFATIADRLWAKVGPGVLPAYARRIGLGRRCALDVFSQTAGALPTPEDLPRLRPKEPKFMRSDAWRMGIGQFAQASPLQCSVIAAAVANGGHVVRPYLVRPRGGPTVSDLAVPAAWLEDVRRGMERVTSQMEHATAKSLVLGGEAAGIKVAAKTGTAEWGTPAMRAAGKAPDHAWLIGYAPADNPTVAFACYIRCGTFGGRACVPVAKRVLERYFAKYGRAGHAYGNGGGP